MAAVVADIERLIASGSGRQPDGAGGAQAVCGVQILGVVFQLLKDVVLLGSGREGGKEQKEGDK